jgi:hypothetical protein
MTAPALPRLKRVGKRTERWLESARLPCAKLLYGGRNYLIRADP